MGRGRPFKLNKDIQRKLVEAIGEGNYYDAACQLAGIDYSTFRKWILRGQEEEKGAFRDFYVAIKKAEAEAENKIIKLWIKQIPEDWRAAATFLERRYPDRWARRDRHEITGRDGGTIDINVGELRNEILGRIAGYAARSGEGDDNKELGE